MTFDVHDMSDQLISSCFTVNNFRIFMTFVYAKCTQGEIRELWHDIEGAMVDDVPWIVVGDFNSIKKDGERLGGHPRPLSAMTEFNSCIHNYGLVEMNYSGCNVVV